ncbi:MAG: TonB-dependent receptor [Flavobacteriales bacterium]|nr:TonB-dependent receptor [Flavobacteriales bacterium]
MNSTIPFINAANTERMRIARLLIASILLILCSNAIQSQNYALGIVYSEEEGVKSPLTGANIRWAGTNEGTISDINGRFELELNDDSDLLVISFTGYLTDSVRYTGDEISLELKSGVLLDAVDVISRKQSTSLFLLDPLNVQKMDSRELRKAACCNLSESFETNASIDASFTDAVSGTRQIRMLGLSGRYSQILKDNVPNVRGLSTIYGLGYIPGDWIEDIHISKGAGSVTSGFESMTGEINVALKDANMSERAHFNIYGNQGGRTEFNGLTKWRVSDAWSTIILGHAEVNRNRVDRNNDNFMDNPLKQDFILRNQWKFQAKENWEGQYSIDYLNQHQESGELDFRAESADLWGMHLDAERIEALAKTGYVLDDAWGSSFGSQFSYTHYDMNLDAGLQSFNGKQETIRANLLYATKLGCAKKGLTVGASYLMDNYSQSLDSLDLSREESVIGAYAEFTWNPNERLSTIIGVRGDEHNVFGSMFSPRLHLRYSLSEDLSLKGAAGRGFRTANPVTDNLGLLASNRVWNIQAPLLQESAWNYGLNLTYKFKLDYREASIAGDAYSTRFDKQTVIDYETPGMVQVYELQGSSFSNTAQVEFSWEMMRRTNIRLAYRYTDAQTDYLVGRREQPFNPRHRGFMNLAYETKKKSNDAQWKVDGTVQLIGKQRIPAWNIAQSTDLSESASPSFVQIHGQVTRIFKEGVEAYVGVENAGDYRQSDPIRSADDPFDDSFDASQIWAPVFGRMVYIGLRWSIL